MLCGNLAVVDAALRVTVAAFQRVQQQLTEPCYNGDKLLSLLTLHHAMYVQSLDRTAEVCHFS